MKHAYIYPLLFGLYPVAALYSHNVNQAFASGTIIPTLAVLGLTAMLMLLLRLVARDADKMALMVAVIVAAIFSFGHVGNAISSWQIGGLALSRPNVLFSVWSVLILASAILILRSRRDFEPLSRILTVVSVVLIALPLLNIVTFKVRAGSTSQQLCVEPPEFAESMTPTGLVKRDIYYIILDRYANAGTLTRDYGFDNSVFLGFLRERGFYVADSSYANYLVTAQSLSSSLNMSYLDCLTGTMGIGSSNWLPLFSMMRDYSVWRFLKSQGYDFVHAGPRWTPTARNEFADLNVGYERVSEFATLLCETTMLYPLLRKLAIVNPFKDKRTRINHQFDSLARLPATGRPKFVFVHFLLPHTPFVFDRDGNSPTRQELSERGRSSNYLHQVEFANRKLMTLVQSLIEKSETHPIIVIQGDEGPYPESSTQPDFTWLKATPEQLAQKMGILNALYLPDVDGGALHQGMSPVNTFRIIFNLYFGAELPLLEDRHFVFDNIGNLYDFVSVTDELARIQ
jgi:hypothetical protein